MKIIGVMMVKNEYDIVESCIRHNLRSLDAIYVLDNQSTDGTRAILGELQREGLPLIISDDPTFVQAQKTKVQNLARSAAEDAQPDWICFLDADEFLMESSVTVRNALSQCPSHAPVQIPWIAYVCTPNDDLNIHDPLQRIRYRRLQPSEICKVIMPGKLIHDVQISLGQHYISWNGQEEPLSASLLKDISLAHFPVRSPEQLMTKTLRAWLSNVATFPGYHTREPEPKANFHYDIIYNKMYKKGALTQADISQIACTYGEWGHFDELFSWDMLDLYPVPNPPIQRYHHLGTYHLLTDMLPALEQALFSDEEKYVLKSDVLARSRDQIQSQYTDLQSRYQLLQEEVEYRQMLYRQQQEQSEVSQRELMQISDRYKEAVDSLTVLQNRLFFRLYQHIAANRGFQYVYRTLKKLARRSSEPSG